MKEKGGARKRERERFQNTALFDREIGLAEAARSERELLECGCPLPL